MKVQPRHSKSNLHFTSLRLLCGVFLFFMTCTSHAQQGFYLDQIANFMNRSIKLFSDSQPCNPQTQVATQLTESTFVQFPPWEKSVAQELCTSSTPTQFTEALCRNATETCVANVRQLFCWYPEQSRFQSGMVRGQVFSYAQKYFSHISHSESLAQRCCHGTSNPTLCQTAFSQTSFEIVRGLPRDSHLAQTIWGYQESPPRRARVEISEGMLLGCHDRDCISRVILHELGHACEAARADTSEALLARRSWGSTNTNCQSDVGSLAIQSDLSHILNDAELNCITRAISANASSGCTLSRLQEVFADAIFLDQLQMPGFAWACTASSDVEHLAPLHYLSCLFQNSERREALCRFQ